MERLIVVEVLDRRGRVRERIRLSQLPAFVGRGHRNDVVLEDRFVSPRHAVISEGGSGELTIEDLGSVNGVTALGGDRFRVGETVLRLVDGDALVPPADLLPPDEGGLLSALRDPRLALGLVLASLAIFFLDAYLGAYYEADLMPVASEALFGLGALAVWSGIWAFANRLLTHRFDYLRHLACASLAAVAYVFVESASEYVEYILSSENAGTAVGLLGGAAASYFLLSAHLAVIPASTHGLRRLWAAGGTSLLFALASVVGYTGPDDFSEEIPVRAPIKAFGSSLLRPQTTAEFLEEARVLKEQADEEAADEP